MSVTVKFDGTYMNKIRNVCPKDIILEKRTISVKGIKIPIQLDYLYDAFDFLVKRSSHKHGVLIINLLKTGALEFYSKTSDYTPDYYADLVLGIGSNSPTRDYVHHNNKIPDVDVYLSGEFYYDY